MQPDIIGPTGREEAKTTVLTLEAKYYEELLGCYAGMEGILFPS